MNEPPADKKPDTMRDANELTVGIPAPSSPSQLLSGTVLGDYLVLETIGSGGGGQVYRAQHQHMGRIVAIKVLPHAAERTAEAVERFRREVRAAARLLHPNIVTAFDAGELGETQYLVMEYVDGKSLFEIIRENGPIPLAQATAYFGSDPKY